LAIDIPLCGDIISLFCKDSIFCHYYLRLVTRKSIDMVIYNIIFSPYYEYVVNSGSRWVVDAFDLRIGNDTVPVGL